MFFLEFDIGWSLRRVSSFNINYAFQMKMLCLLAVLIGSAFAQWEPNTAYNRQALVHLFEWKWTDIADECERLVTSVTNEIQRATKVAADFIQPAFIVLPYITLRINGVFVTTRF